MSFEPMLQQQRKHGSLMPSNILYFLLLRIVFGTLVAGAQPAPKQVVLKPARPATAGEDGSRPYYKLGDSIPVSCLNRTLDTGEHITDEQGQLQYIPFPICNETGQPLELLYGIEKEINCTIDFISDPLFHQLEFYVHNDAPLTCRIPIRPLPSEVVSTNMSPGEVTKEVPTSRNSDYIPLIIALTGTLQLSHLHVANHLNVLIHTTPDLSATLSSTSSSSSIFSIFSPFSSSPSASKTSLLDAAAAYSISSATRTTKVVIGDALPLRFRVRWFPTPALPPGWSGFGGHIHFSTLGYCLLSALSSTALCLSYFRGIELPRRIRSHRRSALGGEGHRYNGWGYGVAKKE